MGAMNELINRQSVGVLAGILVTAAPAARWPALAGAGTGLAELSLRQRTDQVSAALVADLSSPAGPWLRDGGPCAPEGAG